MSAFCAGPKPEQTEQLCATVTSLPRIKMTKLMKVVAIHVYKCNIEMTMMSSGVYCFLKIKKPYLTSLIILTNNISS